MNESICRGTGLISGSTCNEQIHHRGTAVHARDRARAGRPGRVAAPARRETPADHGATAQGQATQVALAGSFGGSNWILPEESLCAQSGNGGCCGCSHAPGHVVPYDRHAVTAVQCIWVYCGVV